MTTPSVDQLLAGNTGGGGGTPWIKFPNVGDERGGRVVAEPEVRQAIDFNTKEPEIWSKSLKPRYELIVKVQTDERDPEIEDDDGVRALHLKDGSLALQAARDAVLEAGAKSIQIGGYLFLKRGKNDDRAYTYTGKYTAPDFLGTAAAPAAAAGEDEIKPITSASGRVYDVPAVAALRASGMSDEQIAKL